MTPEEINNILSKIICKNLIDSKEFYFQKGQDAIKSWLSLSINDSLKKQLIDLGEDYEKLKEAHINNSELKQIIDLLFEITSYCDVHANEKHKYNKYEDNRTIAKAGVRMGDWMAGLIKFKFKHEAITGKSIINAFNYLLDPQNNATILSEKHRAAIATNLLKKEYNPKTFVTELKNYYSKYDIQVSNPDNYTEILSILIYENDKKWKDEVVGLMASDGTKWQDEYIEKIKDYEACIIWNSKRPSGTSKTIKFLKNIISEGETFPLYYSIGGAVNYKADIIDFAESQEELDKKEWDKKHKTLYYNKHFSDYKDNKKAARILFLAKSITKIDPIAVDDFEFYDDYDAPRQDNLTPIKELPKSEENKTFLPDQFDAKDFEEYIRFIREIINRFGLKQGDERLVFSVRNNRLNFIIGQRYCWNLFITDSKGKFGVISRDKLIETSEKFDGSETVPYYTHFDDIDSVKSNINSIENALDDELKRSKKSSFRKYNNSEFENYVFTNQQTKNNNQMNFPLNTILYGPPGTGKTYNTILRAAEIVENRKIDSYDEALKIFKDNLHNRIEFITFHQNYSYEDFIQGLRPETDNKSSLTFDKKDGIFKQIADKALENLKLSQKAPDELSNETLFLHALEKLKDNIMDSATPIKINETAYFTAAEDDAFRYSGDNWTLNDRGFNGFRMKYTDLIRFYEENIAERKDIKELNNISGLAKQHASYFFKAFELVKSMIDIKQKIKSNIEKKNYVIVIDEINRANISRVFGELITLIEPDKRSHGEIPLEAKLPSGDYFVVPSNLYIIGTMNTADKSIALLDIALRRRFEFESMYPLYDIKDSEIYDKLILLKINEQIIKSKGHDFQIGHAYFMGENKDLIQRMNKKVIPLLLEYFMNDEKEVKSILFNAGLQVEENSWPIKITGKRA